MSTTLETIQRIIRDVRMMDETTEIPETASFEKDLGADSLDLVEIVMNIEEEFGIEVQDSVAETCVTVADAVKLVDKIKSV